MVVQPCEIRLLPLLHFQLELNACYSTSASSQEPHKKAIHHNPDSVMRFCMKEHLRQLIKFSEGEKCTTVDPPGTRLFKAESIFEEHMKSNLMTLVEPIYE